MNAQVICDHRRKILLLYTGPCGSVSDLTCFRRTSLCRDMDKGHLFGPDQYILGDSGYMAMSHVVSAYKRSDLSVDKENFNYCVAKARVTNEHCIGVLKSRWHSLKEIRIHLNTPKDNLWLVRWIGTCAKLHNYVISRNDEWSSEDDPITLDCDIDNENNLPERPTVNVLSPGPAGGNRTTLQARVHTHALKFHMQPGGLFRP